MTVYDDGNELGKLPEYTLQTLNATRGYWGKGVDDRTGWDGTGCPAMLEVALGAMRLNLYRAELSYPFVGEEVPRSLWSCNVSFW